MNLISVGELANLFPDDEGMPDEDGTFIVSFRSKSTLTWNKVQYEKTFNHARNKIPEMPINNGYERFFTLCSIIDTVHNPLSSFNNCALRTEVKTKYQKGDNLLYTDDEGATIPVKFKNCEFSNEVLKYIVIDANGKPVTTYKPNLRHKDDLDLSNIPITPADYKNCFSNVTAEELKQFANPEPLNALAQLWLSYHSGIMKHCPKHVMIKLAENGILPKDLLFYKNNPAPICVSCAFGKASKRPKNSSKPSNSIRSSSDNVPGKTVSTDQLISAQPGLVPHSRRSLTGDRITA